ncbi:MAG: HAMP domain-containing histidine kinase [Holophagales bacterium]|nr:HAMP domain-containing histidine kinase [Holophagales bacterium]
MSLRLRLFLLLAALVVLLVGTQAVLVRTLAARLDENVRTVAFRVGEEILSGFQFTTESTDDGGSGGERRVVFVSTGGVDSAPAPAAPGAGDERDHAVVVEGSAATEPEMHWVVRREVQRKQPGEGIETTVEERTFTFEAAPGSGDEGTRAIAHKIALEPAGDPGLLVLHGVSERPRPIPIPKAPIASTLERFRSQLFAGSLAVLAVGLLASAYVAHRATRPLGELADAARRVGEGELGVEVATARADEVGVALTAFNRMSRRLVELDRENRRLADNERLSELGEVARGLAHTLRNPLNALGLSIEQLAAGGDEGERAAELVESSRRQIRRMDGSLRSFLALASAGAAAPEPLDVGSLAREVALEAIQDAGGRVRVEVATPETPVRLAAVAAELRAALQALVVNACEASPDGARVTVTVETAPEGRVRLSVEDEGAGIPESVAARLFEPHVTTKPNGSGIGLFLAQRIATGRYGGSLALERRDRGGTRARLEVGDRIGAAE